MYRLKIHFVDGEVLSVGLQGEDIFRTLEKSIRNGMWLRFDNKLIDLGKVIYIEVEDVVPPQEISQNEEE